MKKVGLDTSFFNYCREIGVSGDRLSTAFKIQDYKPYVSPYVIYELARIFKTNHALKGKELFRLMRDLDSSFITKRDILYNTANLTKKSLFIQ